MASRDSYYQLPWSLTKISERSSFKFNKGIQISDNTDTSAVAVSLPLRQRSRADEFWTTTSYTQQ